MKYMPHAGILILFGEADVIAALYYVNDENEWNNMVSETTTIDCPLPNKLLRARLD